MTPSEESLAVARTLVIGAAAVICIAKILRECGAEALRNRLYVIDAEIFDFVRQGHLDPREPAYKMLRDGVRGIIESAGVLTVTRFVLSSVFGRKLIGHREFDTHRPQWEAALAQVRSKTVQAQIAALAERVRNEIDRFTLFGPVAALLPPSSGDSLYTAPQRRRFRPLATARIRGNRARHSASVSLPA